MNEKCIYDWRPNQPPLRRKSYLGNFMLLNMLGFLWLDGKPIQWPGSELVK